jgi:hypothetical protein
MLITDSYNAFSVLQHGRAKADLSVAVARDIHAYCFMSCITLVAECVPREQNTVADALSKCADASDFTIPCAMFTSISNQWGPFEVDLFAGHANHFVPTFFSRHYSPECAAINAFTQQWGRCCWAHPPYALLSRVLRHAADCGAGICLVCPFWPSAAWWRLLCNPVGTLHRHVHGVREFWALPVTLVLWTTRAPSSPCGGLCWPCCWTTQLIVCGSCTCPGCCNRCVIAIFPASILACCNLSSSSYVGHVHAVQAQQQLQWPSWAILLLATWSLCA